MLYAIEYLEANFEWLLQRLKELGDGAYVVFDLPGQVELSTNHASLTRIVKRLEMEAGCRLVAVHLVDATHVLDAQRYVSLLLLCLRAMLHLELPHLNVLSKVDLLGPLSGGELPMPLENYTDPDAEVWREVLAGEGQQSGSDDDSDAETAGAGPSSRRPPRTSIRPRRRYDALNARLVDVIEDFSLVGFETLAVEDKESMYHLVRTVDKVGGWVFVHAGDEGSAEDGEDDEAMPPELRRALMEDEQERRRAAGEPTGPAGGGGQRNGATAAEAASALSLFTTLDSGIVPGWGRPEDVEERYITSFKRKTAAARAQDDGERMEQDDGARGEDGLGGVDEEEFQRQEEARIYAAYREWKAEQEGKKGGNAEQRQVAADDQQAAVQRAMASRRVGNIEIKERSRSKASQPAAMGMQ